ncbi:type I-B CRISPR-associated protein Cas7/Cst2/DevR [hot springs metagenome]|uniref:Type I-B CRISPR-associated protein Cas7/Cst2/DevR n=1 Tax=hot springs metagenome TaxID=433727 RepID=A0A5J4L5K6_9ZZZZ
MSKNCKLKDGLNAITITSIFEASALNRDEKIGGNIPSIKKLTRGNKGDKGIFSYISRVAMRHYLFETLSKNPLTKDNWIYANCFESGTGDKKVVQLDLRTQNIITHAELDAFGYMFTIGGQQSLARKAAVGITKAVALETWEGDMQFNANHDFASRCLANPNPVNKEEHRSFYKVSFTIDIDKLGYDVWWIKDHNYDDTTKRLTLFLSDKGTDVVLKDVKKEREGQFKIDEHEITIDGLSCTVSKKLMEEKTEKPKNQEEKKYISFKKGKSKSFKIYEDEYSGDDEEDFYQFNIGKYSYDEKQKILTLSSFVLAHSIEADEKEKDKKYSIKVKDNTVGEITIETNGSKKKAIFRLQNEAKIERLLQILEILKNGLIYHVSGENDGIVPQFMIAAGLSLPIPIFNSFVELGGFESSILNNGYILNHNDSKKLVYVYNPKNLVGNIDTKNLYTDWDSFLEQCGVKVKNETGS